MKVYCNLKFPVLQSEVDRDLDKDSVRTEAGIAAEVLLTPKLTFKLPSVPKKAKMLVTKLKFWKMILDQFRKYHIITLLCLSTYFVGKIMLCRCLKLGADGLNNG